MELRSPKPRHLQSRDSKASDDSGQVTWLENHRNQWWTPPSLARRLSPNREQAVPLISKPRSRSSAVPGQSRCQALLCLLHMHCERAETCIYTEGGPAHFQVLPNITAAGSVVAQTLPSFRMLGSGVLWFSLSWLRVILKPKTVYPCSWTWLWPDSPVPQ